MKNYASREKCDIRAWGISTPEPCVSHISKKILTKNVENLVIQY